MTVVKQDGARIAWNIAEEKRVDDVCSKLRYGPTAQDVAAGIGGNGTEIEWDRVNSEYRLAVQGLIIENRDQQQQIEKLITEKQEQAEKIEALEITLADVIGRLEKLENEKATR